jgi:hypothetical protein
VPHTPFIFVLNETYSYGFVKETPVGSAVHPAGLPTATGAEDGAVPLALRKYMYSIPVPSSPSTPDNLIGVLQVPYTPRADRFVEVIHVYCPVGGVDGELAQGEVTALPFVGFVGAPAAFA